MFAVVTCKNQLCWDRNTDLYEERERKKANWCPKVDHYVMRHTVYSILYILTTEH